MRYPLRPVRYDEGSPLEGSPLDGGGVMPDQHDSFKRSLVRMMQAGVLDEMLECRAGEPAAVEFRLERVYQVHLKLSTIVLKEQDRETVRRKLGGRWQRLGPPRVQQDRIVVERPNGNGGQESSAAVAKGTRRPAKHCARQRQLAALVGAV